MKVVNERLLDHFRYSPKCEWCDTPSRGRLEPHHVFAKGMGGGARLDVAINLIALCRPCHDDFHRGRILRCDLLALVAAREGLLQGQIEEEIYRLLREPKVSK